MNQIKISRPSSEEQKNLGIPPKPERLGPWSVWTCEPSTFDWQYSDREVCFIYEGHVKVKTKDEEVEINKGDLVTFPQGLSCTWQVIKPICKVYKFEK